MDCKEATHYLGFRGKKQSNYPAFEQTFAEIVI